MAGLGVGVGHRGSPWLEANEEDDCFDWFSRVDGAGFETRGFGIAQPARG